MILESMFLLTLCVYYEARGEGLEAQVAVAQVVMNRVEDEVERGKDSSIFSVIFAPKQFSWTATFRTDEVDRDEVERMCGYAVKEMERRRARGSTFKGRTFFHDTSIEPPYWTKGMKDKKQIGRLIFYNKR